MTPFWNPWDLSHIPDTISESLGTILRIRKVKNVQTETENPTKHQCLDIIDLPDPQDGSQRFWNHIWSMA